MQNCFPYKCLQACLLLSPPVENNNKNDFKICWTSKLFVCASESSNKVMFKWDPQILWSKHAQVEAQSVLPMLQFLSNQLCIYSKGKTVVQCLCISIQSISEVVPIPFFLFIWIDSALPKCAFNCVRENWVTTVVSNNLWYGKRPTHTVVHLGYKYDFTDTFCKEAPGRQKQLKWAIKSFLFEMSLSLCSFSHMVRWHIKIPF